jgi:triosephosphate isomerase
MEPMRRALIAGNWKMNLDHLQSIAFVQKLAWALKDAGYKDTEAEVAVFPPFTDLRSVQTLINADNLPLKLGGQDLSVHDEGAHTGDISGAFLKALDCEYVIVGHSERRADHQESNETIAAKAEAAVRHGLIPIVCVGETQEDLEKWGPSKVPLEQLQVVLKALGEKDDYVVAYEPVWAIGSGQAATPEQANTVATVLRNAVEKSHGVHTAARTRVLYGGSVKSSNIASFMRRSDIDGALVGGASLDIAQFSAIVRFPHHVTAGD